MNVYDFIEPVLLTDAQGDLGKLIRMAAESRAPFRAAMGVRDDFAYIEVLTARLVADGFELDEAMSLGATVVLNPTLSFRTGNRIAQATVVRAVDASERLGFPIRVLVEGILVETNRVKRIENVQVSTRMIDVDSQSDILDLMVEAAELGRNYPMPINTVDAFQCIVLGRPSSDMTEDSPHAWNDLLTELSRAMGVGVQVITDQSRVRDPFHQSTKVVVALDPSFIGVAQKVGKSPTPPYIPSADSSTRQLIAAIAGHIHLKRLELDGAQTPSRSRELLPGERLFHRKTGSSAAYDRFGDPCKPCAHSLEQFQRYYSAPKAEKGMKRLYTNFEPSMLYHCGRGYGCGVYAVFAPSSM